MSNPQSHIKTYDDQNEWKLIVELQQSDILTNTKWVQTNFVDFIAYFGGVTFSIYFLANIIVSGYQQFVKDTSMLEKLYAEDYVSDDNDYSDDSDDNPENKEEPQTLQ